MLLQARLHFLFEDLPLCTVPGKTMLCGLTQIDVVSGAAAAGMLGAFNSHEMDVNTDTVYNEVCRVDAQQGKY